MASSSWGVCLGVRQLPRPPTRGFGLQQVDLLLRPQSPQLDQQSREGTCVYVLVAPSCPARCGPVDCSLPGSFFRGTLQARTLEWVAIPFSRGSSRPRDRTWVSHTASSFYTI